MGTADVYWIRFAEGGSGEAGSEIFLIVESEFHSGERLVVYLFLIAAGTDPSSAAPQTDRLREAPSVCRVAGGCDDVMLHRWVDGRSLFSET